MTQRGSRSTSESGNRSTGLIVVAGIFAVALVAFIVATVSTGSGEAEVDQTADVSISGTALPSLPQGGTDPALGMEAPEIRGQDFEGNQVAITNDGRAKVILLFAHWCSHCRNEVSTYQDYFDANGLPTGVDLYSISTSADPARPNYPPSEWLADEGWSVPLVVDDGQDSAARALGLVAFPFSVFIDADGSVVGRVAGAVPIESLIDVLDQIG